MMTRTLKKKVLFKTPAKQVWKFKPIEHRSVGKHKKMAGGLTVP